MGSRRVGHDRTTEHTHAHTHIPKKWFHKLNQIVIIKIITQTFALCLQLVITPYF